MKKNIYFILIPCFLLNSCALIFQGKKKDVYIKSMTEGANIYVNGDLQGKDAVTVSLPRKHDHTVMLKKDGYNTYTTQITKKVQVGWIIFDTVFNWFAFLTDPTTGAWNTFDKDKIVVELDPKE